MYRLANAALILADGRVFYGQGVGAEGEVIAELCFNTAMSGYQEVLSDPSYLKEIIIFTFPHIGNYGINTEDNESQKIYAGGAVFAHYPTNGSNFRSTANLDEWLQEENITAISEIDTRALTIELRDKGAISAAIYYGDLEKLDEHKINSLVNRIKEWGGLENKELASIASIDKKTEWIKGGAYERKFENSKNVSGYKKISSTNKTIALIDFGAKDNIARELANFDNKIIKYPARFKAGDILKDNVDGIFLSNGPGDPSKTAEYCSQEIIKLIENNIPIFGICLGHQLIALALGAKAEKLKFGHHGLNHPVLDVKTNKVMITSQNHNFIISNDELPTCLEVSHISLFDGTIEGLSHKSKIVKSLQFHPEASPGPRDSNFYFSEFNALLDQS